MSTRVHSQPYLACMGEEKKEQRKRKRKAGQAGRLFSPPHVGLRCVIAIINAETPTIEGRDLAVTSLLFYHTDGILYRCDVLHTSRVMYIIDIM